MSASTTSNSPSDPAAWNRDPSANRTAFSVPSRAERDGGSRWRDPLPEIRDAAGEPLPSWRDRSMRIVLALTFVLQILVWTRMRGYSVADSVEFMERAQILVHGEPTVDEGLIRPFGFSSVMLPFFVVADWLGMQDPRPISWCINLLQIGLALGLVLYSARVAAQLAGRRAGLVAGLIVGANPVFLQYSTQPVSDIAAALFIALALESLLERGGFKRGLRGGLWLGAALLMAYKSLLIILVLLIVVYLRDGWKRRQFAAGITTGIACGLAVQALLDRLMFGSFGLGLMNYLVSNVLQVIVSFALHFKWRWLAEPLYNFKEQFEGRGYNLAEDLSVRGVQSPLFYLQNLPQMLVWPVIGLLAFGFLHSIRRPTWKRWLLIVAFLASVVIMSNKGSKDFRLWLPLMPLIGGVCACGFSALFERTSAMIGSVRQDRPRSTGIMRGAFATLLIAAVLVLDVRAARALELEQFSGYWNAIDFANTYAHETYPERARAALQSVAHETPPPRLKVASAYNWAVYMRQSPLVDLVKLPWQLNYWKKYDEAKKAADMATLAEMDIFIVHLPTLTEQLDLFDWVNAHYEVLAGYYDQAAYDPGLGPVLVLGRRSGRRDTSTFFDVYTGQSIEAFRQSRELPPAIDFIPPTGAADARLVFLGYEYRVLPGDHLGWITYYWTSPTGLSGDFNFIDRITSPDETNPWQNNHAPAYGMHPTSRWAADEIVSEGFPVVPCAEPYKKDGRFRPLGGPFRRGDLIPARLWMAVVEYDPVNLHGGDLVEKRHLAPAHRASDVPIQVERTASVSETEDGIQFSPDGLVRVGRFFLPVSPAARLSDDGRPIQQ